MPIIHKVQIKHVLNINSLLEVSNFIITNDIIKWIFINKPLIIDQYIYYKQLHTHIHTYIMYTIPTNNVKKYTITSTYIHTYIYACIHTYILCTIQMM